MDFSTSQVVWAALVSSGVLGGIWTAYVWVTGRLDLRKKRIAEDRAKDISSAADIQKLNLDASAKASEEIWNIIKEYKTEIKDLKCEVEQAEADERLKRPDVMHIYECVRRIKNEMDSLNIMLLSDEETNVFARRWGNIKVIMVDLEATLAGQRKRQEEKDSNEQPL